MSFWCSLVHGRAGRPVNVGTLLRLKKLLKINTKHVIMRLLIYFLTGGSRRAKNSFIKRNGLDGLSRHNFSRHSFIAAWTPCCVKYSEHSATETFAAITAHSLLYQSNYGRPVFIQICIDSGSQIRVFPKLIWRVCLEAVFTSMNLLGTMKLH